MERNLKQKIEQGRLTLEEFRRLAEKQNASRPRKAPVFEEHNIQVACFNRFRQDHAELEGLLFAVPNGGRRSARTASDLKAEGVVAGVSDLILMVRNSRYGAFCIEMKTAKGVQRKEQKEWQAKVEKAGYKYSVIRSVDDFVKQIEEYLKIK